MALCITKEVAALKRMTVGQLQEKYAETFGEQTRGRHKQWLVKRIAWRMQANEEGDLSERARQRAAELANDADLRLTAPKTLPINSGAGSRTTNGTVRRGIDTRLPMPGTVITRDYKGETLEVNVLDDGFEHEGDFYKSLSALAKAITGSHVNGFAFFGLAKNGGRK